MRSRSAIMAAAAALVLAIGVAVTVGPRTARQPSEPAPTHPAKQLKITILATMLAEKGIGEWGFAALVEVDGKKILFDTGARPDTVSKNAPKLSLDLGDVDQVVLSHHHGDHTGGLLTL